MININGRVVALVETNIPGALPGDPPVIAVQVTIAAPVGNVIPRLSNAVIVVDSVFGDTLTIGQVLAITVA